MPFSTARRAQRAKSSFSADQTVPLVEVTRSGVIESVHLGAIVAVDGDGTVLAHAGSTTLPTYWRSAAKLHQALAMVLAGGVKRWAFDDAQLAIMCGSHHGEPAQVRCVASILDRIGMEPAALHCGPRMPRSGWAAAELIRRGEKPTELHHMCSGNHAGLLALSRLLGGDPEGYETPSAPAEQSALEIAARFAGLAPSDVFLGTDGCGIPAYRTPLSALALAFARLVAPPAEWEARLQSAASTIVNAVVRHPDFISATGDIEAEFIKAFDEAAVCKLGAEGVGGVAFRASDRYPRGVGIALKIADGAGARAVPVVLADCVAQLDLGTEAQRAALESHVTRAVTTHRGDVVGELTPVFELIFDEPSAGVVP